VARVVESAEKRGLTIDTEVENTAIVTDPLLWTAVLNNLLGNAVTHAPKEAPELEAEDIPHLFERFWRKSEARSEKGPPV
jgi:signal transduction histidine kinase